MRNKPGGANVKQAEFCKEFGKDVILKSQTYLAHARPSAPRPASISFTPQLPI
jgi:hypothetical protein